jgi:hypothetical protein
VVNRCYTRLVKILPYYARGVSSCPNKDVNTFFDTNGPTVRFPVRGKLCRSALAVSLLAHFPYAMFSENGVGYLSIIPCAISGPKPGTAISIPPHTFRRVLRDRFVLVSLALYSCSGIGKWSVVSPLLHEAGFAPSLEVNDPYRSVIATVIRPYVSNVSFWCSVRITENPSHTSVCTVALPTALTLCSATPNELDHFETSPSTK